MMYCCVPQGVWPAPVCGGSSARHGCQRVCSHDHLPQQGAVRWEPDAAAGQSPQRCHRPAAKVREKTEVNPWWCGWVLQPCETCCPFWGRRKHGLMYGLLISDFCFSKVKCNILLPRPHPYSHPPPLYGLWWAVMRGGGAKNLPKLSSQFSQSSGKLQMLLDCGCDGGVFTLQQLMV